jgi:hypothetical protein
MDNGENGKWKVENGKLKRNEQLRMDNGQWRKRKVESGKLKTEN